MPDGFRTLYLDEITSTNSWLLERARDGEPSHLWVRAGRQTVGRGRQGRVWTSEPGNLYASLMLRDPAPPERFGELPLVVAIAVHDAISDIMPPMARVALQIKWPNDVLYDGAKICGILVEGAALAEGRVVVIGCGINCAHHPDGAHYRTNDLATLGFPTDPAILFERLADRLARRLVEWQSRPFAFLRDAWLARARGVGEAIRVRLPDREATGVFDGLETDGRLILRHADGRRELISAGDVFFG